MKIHVISWLLIVFACEFPAHAVEVHGHRGARARLPENTIPAFSYAIEVGADVLEMDLGVTRDGILVISHERHISPEICRDAQGKPPREGLLIHSLSLKEVKAFDCGSVANPKFPDQKTIPGTRIPTLDEVFDLVRESRNPNAKKIRFNIETKIDPRFPNDTVDAQTFSELVVRAFRKSGFLKRIILQSFDPRTLIAAKKREPTLITSFLTEDPKIDLLAETRRAGALILSPDYHLVTQDMVQRFHAAGLQVVPWTVNNFADQKRILEMGVDGIIIDDPAPLIKFLKSQ